LKASLAQARSVFLVGVELDVRWVELACVIHLSYYLTFL